MLALTSPVLAMYKLPLIPAPPITTNAPVLVLVLTLPLAATMLPPTKRFPPIPVPPTTTNAPVLVL